ncbi:MAG: hypothetical protein WD876_02300 [Candidatus Pacearchaeota archaeon]
MNKFSEFIRKPFFTIRLVLLILIIYSFLNNFYYSWKDSVLYISSFIKGVVFLILLSIIFLFDFWFGSVKNKIFWYFSIGISLVIILASIITVLTYGISEIGGLNLYLSVPALVSGIILLVYSIKKIR